MRFVRCQSMRHRLPRMGIQTSLFCGCLSMVIKRGCSFIKSPRVPGVRVSLEIQMMTELVTQSTQEGSERGDLFRTAVFIQTRIRMVSG